MALSDPGLDRESPGDDDESTCFASLLLDGVLSALSDACSDGEGALTTEGVDGDIIGKTFGDRSEVTVETSEGTDLVDDKEDSFAGLEPPILNKDRLLDKDL